MFNTTRRVKLDIQKHLLETGAQLKGHFLLSSGLHSDQYFQCAKLLQYPALARQAGEALAALFEGQEIDLVVAPAMGGLIIGHEVAAALGVRFVFGERSGDDNRMTIRRGFDIEQGEKVLMAEDVITTGGSILELKQVVDDLGGKVMGYASIVNRSAKKIEFNAPWRSLITVKVNTYRPEDCPMCKEGSKPVKPGSRKKRDSLSG